MTAERQQMEADDASDGSNGHTPGTPPSPGPTSSSGKDGRLVAVPVAKGSSGVGLPYAPEDWPNPGDMWRWKVGSRTCISGHWHDRYLYPPPSCPRPGGSKGGFQSKSSVIEYLREEYPQQDIGAFFSSFIWRVLAIGHDLADIEKGTSKNPSSRKLNTSNGSKSVGSPGDCKAGNALCSVHDKPKGNLSPARDCDICCSEVGFCRNCCCILCSKFVDWVYEGYSFIRCEARLDETYICGHAAHMECALRSYMAGSVGGSIGLNVEYYCRRCDNKTDLMPHVSKILKVCGSLDSRDDVAKILNLCLCILRSSEQKKAKNLSNDIELAISKLNNGVHLGQIWKVEDHEKLVSRDMHDPNEIIMLGTVGRKRKVRKIDCTNDIDPLHKVEEDGTVQRPCYVALNHNSLSANLEDEIDKVLQELKRSQESEYRLAELKLYYQKDFVLSLYRQLDSERHELANPRSLSYGGDFEALLSNIQHRVGQIKHEEERLKQMMKVAQGFGRIPKSILAENFELIIDD